MGLKPALWSSVWLIAFTACTLSGASGPPSSPKAILASASSQAAPTPQPPAIPRIEVLKSGYSCRLPVTWAGASDRNSFAHGGLLDLSTGAIEWSGQDAVRPRSFSWSARKWVPVRWQWLAPDGLRYADWDQAGLHVVDVRTGADRVISTLGGEVIAWAGEGIYAWDSTLPSMRLIRFDPKTGKSVELYRGDASKRFGTPENVQWDWIAGASAWSVAYPRESSGAITAAQLVRLDMTTGAVTVWLNDAGQTLALLGLDSQGRPLVSIGAGHGYEVWLGLAPNQFRMIDRKSVV